MKAFCLLFTATMMESAQEGSRGKAAHEAVGVPWGSAKERAGVKCTLASCPQASGSVITETQIHSCNNYINQRLLLTLEIGASNFNTFWYEFSRD